MPCETDNFDALMTTMSKPLAPYVVGGYPWGRHRRIADFGGASGEVLKAVLRRYGRGRIDAAFVVDLPQVREDWHSPDTRSRILPCAVRSRRSYVWL